MLLYRFQSWLWFRCARCARACMRCYKLATFACRYLSSLSLFPLLPSLPSLFFYHIINVLYFIGSSKDCGPHSHKNLLFVYRGHTVGVQHTRQRHEQRLVQFNGIYSSTSHPPLYSPHSFPSLLFSPSTPTILWGSALGLQK